jgi:hypothetical protein
VIDSYYLLTLGSYRGFYILNWLVRGFGKEKFWDPFADVFGIIQTAFYIDFAWVYYSRQRVKLRRGGVVDSEDFSRSWLVNKLLNFRGRRSAGDEEHRPLHDEEAEEEAEHGREGTNRWGARGISVSAEDTLDSDGRPEAHGSGEGLGEILEDEDSHWQEHTGTDAQHSGSSVSPVGRE